MIDDSAGLVDPITGEGLYYALRSAELCAGALLAEKPDCHQDAVEAEVLPELKLAARVSQRFYNEQIFGGSVLDQMVSLAAKNASFRELDERPFCRDTGLSRPTLAAISQSPCSARRGHGGNAGLAVQERLRISRRPVSRVVVETRLAASPTAAL